MSWRKEIAHPVPRDGVWGGFSCPGEKTSFSWRRSDSVLDTLVGCRTMFHEQMRNWCFPSRQVLLLRLPTIPFQFQRTRVIHRGSQFDSSHLETSHCSIYPRQEACNSGEDCRRGPHSISIGDNALGHIATYQGASGVPLWVMREGKTLSHASLLHASLLHASHSCCLKVQPSETAGWVRFINCLLGMR